MPFYFVLQRFSGSSFSRTIGKSFTSLLFTTQSLVMFLTGSTIPDLLNTNDLAYDTSSVLLFGGAFNPGTAVAESDFETDAGAWSKSGSLNCLATRLSGPLVIDGTYSASVDSSAVSGSLSETDFGTAVFTQIFTSPIKMIALADLPYSLAFTVKNIGSAFNGAYLGEIVFSLESGLNIHYQFRLDKTPLPDDTVTDKYILLETTLPINTSLVFTRNIFADFNIYRLDPLDSILSINLISWGASVYTAPGGNLNAPTNLNFTGSNLLWTDTNINEQGTYIERSGGSFFVRLGQVGSNITTFNIVRSRSTAYSYRVQAFNGTQVSAYSNVITVDSSEFDTVHNPEPPSTESSSGDTHGGIGPQGGGV